jgi:hypothetical protein
MVIVSKDDLNLFESTVTRPEMRRATWLLECFAIENLLVEYHRPQAACTSLYDSRKCSGSD